MPEGRLHLAITSNGPGEFAGWVRPLLRALFARAPQTDVTLFFVPDDYATGREPDVARRLFPNVRIVDSRAYVGFALGRAAAAAPPPADVVQYLGGDLLHAARVRARLGGKARTYKFASKRSARSLDRAYAVDAKNAGELAKLGLGSDRLSVIGNLAIDGALAEAAGAFPSDRPDAEFAPDGILLMPGSRRHEVANVLPLFLQAALRLRSMRPDLRVAFALSPFTLDDEVARAFATGGHRNVWGARGALVPYGGGIGVRAATGGEPFAIVREAMRHAPRAAFVVTLPGTKCIELAALGVPTIVCVPLNAPEAVVINGPLQYIDRIPFLGTILKRSAVVAYDLRFPVTAQPNMDAGEMLMPEVRGTLMPAELARIIARYADDAQARATASQRLRALYADHVGAADRMAASLLEAAS
jgi:lipid-A-disaccharide synthase